MSKYCATGADSGRAFCVAFKLEHGRGTVPLRQGCSSMSRFDIVVECPALVVVCRRLELICPVLGIVVVCPTVSNAPHFQFRLISISYQTGKSPVWYMVPLGKNEAGISSTTGTGR